MPNFIVFPRFPTRLLSGFQPRSLIPPKRSLLCQPCLVYNLNLLPAHFDQPHLRQFADDSTHYIGNCPQPCRQLGLIFPPSLFDRIVSAWSSNNCMNLASTVFNDKSAANVASMVMWFASISMICIADEDARSRSLPTPCAGSPLCLILPARLLWRSFAFGDSPISLNTSPALMKLSTCSRPSGEVRIALSDPYIFKIEEIIFHVSFLEDHRIGRKDLPHHTLGERRECLISSPRMDSKFLRRFRSWDASNLV